MPINRFSNNPFQMPQFLQKPVQQQPRNPFLERKPHFGGFPGGPIPQPGDAFTAFQSQIANRQINPNLERPRPHEGAGRNFIALG